MNRKRNTTIRSGNSTDVGKSASRPAVIFLLLLLSGAPASAQTADSPPAIALGLPLQCQSGENCWAANYLDINPGPGISDFRCGARTYDGHDGVDFAIRDRGVMAAGVPVLASAAGSVKSVRDGMGDTGLLAPGAETGLKGRECGNGVVIDHDGGWQTQYCHLRQGSIVVQPGESVSSGATLGAVGMSGWAEFPHVHLAVRRLGRVVDPFTGLAAGTVCGQAAAALWRKDLHVSYEPAALYNAGFSAGPPDIGQIRAGQAGDQPLTSGAPALVLWVEILGVAQGDLIRFNINGPDGTALLTREQQVDKTQARRYIYVGKRRTRATWPAGEYRGEVTLIRSRPGADPWQDSIERVITLR